MIYSLLDAAFHGTCDEVNSEVYMKNEQTSSFSKTGSPIFEEYEEETQVSYQQGDKNERPVLYWMFNGGLKAFFCVPFVHEFRLFLSALNY